MTTTMSPPIVSAPASAGRTETSPPVPPQAGSAYGYVFVYIQTKVAGAFSTADLIRNSADAGNKALKLMECLLDELPTTLSGTNFRNFTALTRSGINIYDFIGECKDIAKGELRNASLYKRCYMVFFTVVDFGGALLTLSTHNIISLGRITATMSKIPVLRLATTMSLSTVVTVAVVAGFVFLTLETLKKRGAPKEDQTEVGYDLKYAGGILISEALGVMGFNAIWLRRLTAVSVYYGLKSFCYTKNKEAEQKAQEAAKAA